MGEEFVMRACEWGCGFSRYVTLGNQADLGAAEVVAGFAGHEATRVVAMYAEDFGDGRRLADAAAAVAAAGTPVVLLAPGRSAAGARAARSHTGSLASGSAAVEAACRAAGALRVDSPRELFEVTVALQGGVRRRGSRVAVVSDGGGPGGVAADALEEAGLSVPELAPATVARLREALPGSAGGNPLDFALGTIEPDAFARALGVVASASEVDAVLAVGQLGYWSARFPHFQELAAAEVKGAAAMAKAAAGAAKPLVVSTVYSRSAPAAELRARGVPVYREIASGVAALGALAPPAAAGVPVLPDAAPPLQTPPGYLEARALLAESGVPFAAAAHVKDAQEACAAAAELGYPVVLKALGALHKSDAGGVVLGIGDDDELRATIEELAARLDPSGYSLERQVRTADGVELIAGCRRDERFGPLLLIGLGGVLAEVFADVRTALAPASPATVAAMVRELRGAALLEGVRGRPAPATAAACEAAAALSRFAAAHAEVSDVEVNPLLVLPDRVLGLDARILLGATDSGDG